MVFGWTWGYCENDLLMPEIRVLSKYLRAHPPLHLVVAALAGVKPAPEPQKDDIQDLFAAFSAAGGKVKS